MARRQFRQPRVGDLNIRPPLPRVDPIEPTLDLDDYSTDELINMLLSVAPEKALDLVSIEKCSEHWDKKWVECGGNELQNRFQVAVDIVYCKGCWLWFRYTKSTKEAKYYNEQPKATINCSECGKECKVAKSKATEQGTCLSCKFNKLNNTAQQQQANQHIHGVHRGNRK
jgi:hypothetical protein